MFSCIEGGQSFRDVQCKIPYFSAKRSALKLFTASVLVFFFAVVCEPVFALQESRLWLPKKYQYLMPRLVNAANTVESSQDCVEVVDAQLDVGRSTDTLPVFRIICRNTQGVTYIVRISGDPVSESARKQADEDAKKSAGVSVKQWKDSENVTVSASPKGNSEPVSESDDDPIDIDEILRELEEGDAELDGIDNVVGEEVSTGFEDIDGIELVDDIELVDESEEANTEPDTPKIIEPIEQEKGWSICLQAVEKKTANMLKRTVHAEPRPQPQYTSIGETIYQIDFVAANPLGLVLNYQASCKVLSSGIVRVTVGTRKSDPKTATTTVSKDSVKENKPSVETLPLVDKKTDVASDVSEPQDNVSEPLDANVIEDGWIVVEE